MFSLAAFSKDLNSLTSRQEEKEYNKQLKTLQKTSQKIDVKSENDQNVGSHKDDKLSLQKTESILPNDKTNDHDNKQLSKDIQSSLNLKQESIFCCEVKYKKPKSIQFEPYYMAIDLKNSEIRIFATKQQYDDEEQPKDQLNLLHCVSQILSEKNEPFCVDIATNNEHHCFAFENEAIQKEALKCIHSTPAVLFKHYSSSRIDSDLRSNNDSFLDVHGKMAFQIPAEKHRTQYFKRKQSKNILPDKEENDADTEFKSRNTEDNESMDSHIVQDMQEWFKQGHGRKFALYLNKHRETMTIETMTTITEYLKRANATFMMDFLAVHGLAYLCSLAQSKIKNSDWILLTLQCIFAIFNLTDENNKNVGQSIVTEHRFLVQAICDMFANIDVKVRTNVLKLLSLICACDENGSKKVLESMAKYGEQCHSRHMFDPFIIGIYFESDLEFRLNALTLINAILKSLPSIEARIEARNHLIELGFANILHQLQDEIESIFES